MKEGYRQASAQRYLEGREEGEKAQEETGQRGQASLYCSPGGGNSLRVSGILAAEPHYGWYVPAQWASTRAGSCGVSDSALLPQRVGVGYRMFLA